MKPGDVYIVRIPELGTHEQSGTRPAVVIARVTKTIVTIIPCTSNKLALRFPYTYEIAKLAGELIRDAKDPIEFPDAVIAAAAILHDAKLFTLNKKNFVRISKLELY